MRTLLAILCSALVLGSAHAATLQPEKSELRFGFKQMGVPVEGRFLKFDAALDLDLKKPEAGKIAFSVDLGSVSLGDPSFDAELAKPLWFDTKRNGRASFVSSSIKPTAPGHYDVAGKLSIKGASRDVVVPITLNAGVAAGSVTLKRLDYKIGDGEWSDTSVVANDVVVRFKLAFSGL